MTLAWVVGLHFVTAIGIWLLPLPPLSAIIASAAVLFIGGLGTTVAYHRCLAHRSVKVHAAVLQPMILFTIFNGSGTPRQWVAMHRLHHAVSDRDDDISSPRHGFWWSHLRWLWQADHAPSLRYAPDLDVPLYRGWAKMQLPLLFVSVTIGALFGLGHGWQAMLSAALWFGPVRLLWALHAQCTINSICHMGAIDPAHGSGKNVWWLTLLHMGQGENWHLNHHRQAGNARLGLRWYQVDIGWWMVGALRACRLASLRSAK